MLWRRKQRELDLERELGSDLELEADEQREKGLSPEEARLAARRALGNTSLLKETCAKPGAGPVARFCFKTLSTHSEPCARARPSR